MSNTKLATEVIEESKYNTIDDLSRSAIGEVYKINDKDLIKIENIVRYSNSGYCRVIDLTKQLHTMAFDPINENALVSISTEETTAIQYPQINGLGFDNVIQYPNNNTVAEVVEPTQTVLGTNDIHSTNEVFETDTEGSEAVKLIQLTNQTEIVVPTKELIKEKGTDFRVILALSTISNVENNTKVGDNSRYISVAKVDRNMNELCEAVGVSVSQFRKHLRTLLKADSNEFKLVEKIHNDKKVMCYEIEYTKGGFIKIPIDKVEILLNGLSNNDIKLYTNLLWLCNKDGEFIEKDVTQSYLCEQMGLKESMRRAVGKSTEALEGANLIKTKKVWVSETVIKDGMLNGSKTKSKLYYSIVVD